MPTPATHRPALHDQLGQLSRLPAKNRQERILASPRSLDLARSLSSESLFYTLKEIGLTDAVGLLGLASPEQVRDMMDLDCWRRDRLDAQRILSWLMFLDEAGSGKLAEWALHADVELLVWLVKRHCEVVRKADVEHEPDFNPSRYFSFDDQYLLRFVGDEEPILALLLERLRVLDYRFYTHILEQTLFELETQLEEEALRWRTARLADRGYPDFEQAREIFQTVPPHTVRPEQYRRAGLRPLRSADAEGVIPPDHAVLLVSEPHSFFGTALAAADPAIREQVNTELAYLTNRVVMAEACDTGELSEVRRCVELVHDVLNIGLEYAAQGDPTQAARLIQDTQLHAFFQIGWSLVLGLYQQSKHLETVLQKNVGSPERQKRKGGGPTFEVEADEVEADWQRYVDTPFRETYAGVRRPMPVFFQGLETPGEVLYRRFHNLADVRRVETVLAYIPHWFAALRPWVDVANGPADQGLSLEAVWNTAFIGWVVGHEFAIQPLWRTDVEDFQRAFEGTPFDQRYAEFVSLAARHLAWSADEDAAMRVLAGAARPTLQEIVELPEVDFRFMAGLFLQR
jgi:hypothetical protein